MRHVIIGASAAGLAAAEAILTAAPDSDVTVIDRDAESPYARPLISYWLAGEAAADQVRLPVGVLSGVKLVKGKIVTRIDPSGSLDLADGSSIPWDRLLLATGADSKKLGIEGEAARGVFGFRTWADAEAIDRCVKQGAGRALVLGGGLVGVKAALALAGRGVEVSVCIASAYALSQNVGSAAGTLAVAALEEQGIRVRTGHIPTAVESGAGGVTGVRFSAPVIGIPCDIVIRGKGVEPCSELRGGGGAIPVDEGMATGIPGVWAAGDVASCLDLVSGQRTTNAIWPVAVEQGRVAGLNMTGAKERYAGSFARNSVRIGDWHFVSAGLPAREAEGCEIRTRRTKDGLRQIVVRAHNLVGFVHAQRGATGPVNAGLSVNATGLGAPWGSLGFDPLDPDAHWGRSYYSQTANLR